MELIPIICVDCIELIMTRFEEFGGLIRETRAYRNKELHGLRYVTFLNFVLRV